jgi:cytochrome c6
MSSSHTGVPAMGTLLAWMFLLAGLGFAASGFAASISNGGQLYAMHCVSCHGANGTPTMVGAPDFKRSQVLLRPDAQLVQSLKRGRGAMPAYLGIMNERELLDVVAYMRTLN